MESASSPSNKLLLATLDQVANASLPFFGVLQAEYQVKNKYFEALVALELVSLSEFLKKDPKDYEGVIFVMKESEFLQEIHNLNAASERLAWNETPPEAFLLVLVSGNPENQESLLDKSDFFIEMTWENPENPSARVLEMKKGKAEEEKKGTFDEEEENEGFLRVIELIETTIWPKKLNKNPVQTKESRLEKAENQEGKREEIKEEDDKNEGKCTGKAPQEEKGEDKKGNEEQKYEKENEHQESEKGKNKDENGENEELLALEKKGMKRPDEYFDDEDIGNLFDKINAFKSISSNLPDEVRRQKAEELIMEIMDGIEDDM